MDIIGNIVEDIININYKIIIEVFIEVYFKAIIKRQSIYIFFNILPLKNNKCRDTLTRYNRHNIHAVRCIIGFLIILL